MSNQAVAQLKRNRDGTWAEPLGLHDHMLSVGALAEGFAKRFGNGDWAHIAGLWHDLGKFNPEIQKSILKGEEISLDHGVSGALHAFSRFGAEGKLFAKVLAYLLVGHEEGLPDWHHEKHPNVSLSGRLQNSAMLSEVLSGLPPRDILEASLPTTMYGGENEEHLHLWIRMLHSCLVDADFLDTEAYLEDRRPAAAEDDPRILGTLKTLLDAYMEQRISAMESTPMNALRHAAFGQCRVHAAWEPGFFSLSLPSGGGKTLSGMAFALNHALCHGKRRIIIALPTGGAVEQVAAKYRSIFGDSTVLEHHAELDADPSSIGAKIAAEAWNAPIVVTSHSVLFGALIDSRSSRCRKLHNIVDSVLILDELQMISPSYLQIVLSLLKGLVGLFGCSVLLSTSTRHSLDGSLKSGHSNLEGFAAGSVRELVSDLSSPTNRLQRIAVRSHRELGKGSSWDDIAAELCTEAQVLCIVNTCAQFNELIKRLPADTRYLSPYICPRHRLAVVAEIQKTLSRGDPIRLVSTPLVESGVDLDFPVVYRALAGFDSIAHAAGLCNREGRMGDTGSQGRMVVFQVPSDILPDTLAKRQEAGLQTFHCFADLAKSLHPDVYTAYYRILYHRVPSFDEKNIMGLLAGPNAAPIIDGSGFQIQFNSASGRLQCTDQANSLPVVVGYRAQAVQDAPELEGIDLVSQWEEKGPDRKILQLLQGFIVLVPEDMVHGMTKKGLLRPVRFLRDVYVQAVRMAESPKTPFYDPIRGLRLDLSACRV